MIRRVGLVTGLGLAVCAGVLSYALSGQDAPPSGRLDPGFPTSTSFAVVAMRPFTFGVLILKNPTHSPAVLDEVKLQHTSNNVHVVRIAAALIPRDAPNGSTATADYFPPHEKLHAVQGFVFPAKHPGSPAQYLQIVIGLRADKPGYYSFRSVSLDYRMGGHRYRLVAQTSFSWCATRSHKPPTKPCRQLPVAR